MSDYKPVSLKVRSREVEIEACRLFPEDSHEHEEATERRIKRAATNPEPCNRPSMFQTEFPHPDTGRDTFLTELPGLPAWAYPKNVKVIAEYFGQKGEQGQGMPLTNVAGAAIPLGWAILTAKWGFYPCFALLVRHSSKCTANGFAQYPWWVWGALIPVQTVSTGLEYLCQRYIIVPKYQTIRRCQLLGITTPYHIWLLAKLCLSLLNSFDTVSDSAFFGSIVKTQDCSAGPEIESIWSTILAQSPLGRAGIDWLVPSAQHMAAFAWAAAFLQLSYAISESCPIWQDFGTVNYEMETTPGLDYNHRYRTLGHCEEATNHGNALMAIAEVSGMATVVSDDIDYATIRAQMAYDRNSKDPSRYIFHIQNFVTRGTNRAFLAGAVTNGLQLNVQAIILMIRMSLGGGRVANWGQPVLSVFLSCGGLLQRCADAHKRVSVSREWCAKIQVVIDGMSDGEAEEKKKTHAIHDLGILKRWTCYLAIMMWVCAIMALWALVNFLLSLRCKHHLWSGIACVSME